MTLAWIDIVVLLIMTLFVLRNMWIGFLRGVSSFLGLIAGIFFSKEYHIVVYKILSPWLVGRWVHVFSYILTFLLAFLIVFIVFELLRKFFYSVRLSWIDRILGFFLGAFKGFILVCLIFILLVTFFPRSDVIFKNSFTYPYIVSGTRFLIEVCPGSWKSRFNYNLRHYFGYEKKG